MQTSITNASTTPSIASSYNRIYGGTPVISESGSRGSNKFKLKPKKESALEGYEAEKAVMDKAEADKISSDPGYAALKELQKIQGQYALDRLNQSKLEEEKMRSRFNLETGGRQDFQKWRNFQDVQSGTARGQSLMQQRLAELGGDVNSAEYKGLSSQLRNAQLAQKPNTLW